LLLLKLAVFDFATPNCWATHLVANIFVSEALFYAQCIKHWT
jgi:hypothetical protein